MKNGKSMIICPAKKGGVSIIAMAPVDLWRITSYKGIDNLQVIKELDQGIYPYEILKDFRSYLDLDQYEDLSSALNYMKKYSIYKNRLVRKILHEILTSDC
jgi:2-phospho-L-lactate guanylyltransferase (CobY/MobA/RfbA family)